jgi:hypothetical protein
MMRRDLAGNMCAGAELLTLCQARESMHLTYAAGGRELLGGTSSPISAQPVRPSRSWRAWLRGKLTSLHAAAQTDAAIPIDALDMAAQGWRLRAAPAAEKLCAHAAIDNGDAKEYNK